MQLGLQDYGLNNEQVYFVSPSFAAFLAKNLLVTVSQMLRFAFFVPFHIGIK